MNVMLDLNVLLEVIQKRQPHFAASAAVVGLAARGSVAAQIPSHALTTIHYVVRKHAGQAKADETIDWLLGKLRVAPAGKAEYLRARTLEIADFEDAVVASLAEAGRCRCIVTRNVEDFGKSPVPAVTPEEFLASLPGAA